MPSELVRLSKQALLNYLFDLEQEQIPNEVENSLFYSIHYPRAIFFLKKALPFYKWSKELVRKNLERLEKDGAVQTIYLKTEQRKLFKIQEKGRKTLSKSLTGVDGFLQEANGLQKAVNDTDGSQNSNNIYNYNINKTNKYLENNIAEIDKISNSAQIDILPSSDKFVPTPSEKFSKAPAPGPYVFHQGFLQLKSVADKDDEKRSLGKPALKEADELQVLETFKRVYGNRTVGVKTPAVVEGIPRALKKFKNFFGDQACSFLCLALEQLAQEQWLKKSDPAYFAKSSPKNMFSNTRLENYLLPLADHLARRKDEGKQLLDPNLHNPDGSIKPLSAENQEAYRKKQEAVDRHNARLMEKLKRR